MHVRLPWLGSVSDGFAKLVSAAVRHCCFAAGTCVVSSAGPVLPSVRGDVLPPHRSGSLMYIFRCGCGSHCMGGVAQGLDVGVERHVPAGIRDHRGALPRTF